MSWRGGSRQSQSGSLRDASCAQRSPEWTTMSWSYLAYWFFKVKFMCKACHIRPGKCFSLVKSSSYPSLSSNTSQDSPLPLSGMHFSPQVWPSLVFLLLIKVIWVWHENFKIIEKLKAKDNLPITSLYPSFIIVWFISFHFFKNSYISSNKMLVFIYTHIPKYT